MTQAFDLSKFTPAQLKALATQAAQEAKAKARKNPVTGSAGSIKVGPSGTLCLIFGRMAPYYADEWFAILSEADRVVNGIRENLENPACSLGKTPERQQKVRALLARQDVQDAVDNLVKVLRS